MTDDDVWRKRIRLLKLEREKWERIIAGWYIFLTGFFLGVILYWESNTPTFAKWWWIVLVCGVATPSLVWAKKNSRKASNMWQEAVREATAKAKAEGHDEIKIMLSLTLSDE